MTSRLMSILKMLGPRSATTVANPNSWAVVSLWRRLFEQQEQEEEEIRNILCQILGISVDSIRPVAAEANHVALTEFTRETHRNNMMAPRAGAWNPRRLVQHQQQQQQQQYRRPNGNDLRQAREAQQIHTPNLSIPDGDSYLTLPQ